LLIPLGNSDFFSVSKAWTPKSRARMTNNLVWLNGYYFFLAILLIYYEWSHASSISIINAANSEFLEYGQYAAILQPGYIDLGLNIRCTTNVVILEF
jgi:hypothetical protein